MTQEQISEEWTVRKLPPNMTRNYEFDSYSQMRQFLDDLADLSEKRGYYPNLNFNRTEVKVNIETEQEELGTSEYTFAAEVDSLLP